jgi:hypothetical protein
VERDRRIDGLRDIATVAQRDAALVDHLDVLLLAKFALAFT